MVIPVIKRVPWKLVSLLAITFAALGANTKCWWIAHNPVVPEELKKLKRI